VSAMQLHGGNLSELVGAVLKETGLDPSRLELEITETCLIKDIGRALAVLRQLKSLGVQIAMDDFGTG
ncbi:EAL domain-containing protein, partial [Mesorhizobium tamadayense]